MTLRTIIQPDNPVLRRKARRVVSFDRRFQRLVDDMLETMQEASGIGLAAPQVGVSQRVFVVRLPEGQRGSARGVRRRRGRPARHREPQAGARQP